MRVSQSPQVKLVSGFAQALEPHSLQVYLTFDALDFLGAEILAIARQFNAHPVAANLL